MSVPLLPVALTASVSGDTAYVHAACATVNVDPAIVKVPARLAVPGFVATS